MMYFCFGLQIWHILFHSLISYAIMLTFPAGSMEILVFLLSMGHVSVCHIYRQLYDYGGYTLDITGPLMINVQRISSLACSLADGRVKDQSKLSSSRKQHAVKKNPSLLELLSYVFSFHNTICGPFAFFDDYQAFIEGNTAKKLQNGDMSKQSSSSEPSPFWPVLKKIFFAFFYVFLALKVVPIFPISTLRESSFQDKSFLIKMFLVIMITTAQRPKYYFAWSIGEAANNNAGFGISGYDGKGNAKWDLVNNADVAQIEFCTSLKVLLDNWNKTTTYWLRHVVYDRVPAFKMLAVFAVSGTWHGFYPGYYITFFTGFLFTTAGRSIRKCIRPMFQGSKQSQFLYDVITSISTRVVLGYLTFSFVLLEFEPSWIVLKQIFFWMHGAALFAILVLPRLVRKNQTKKE
ncbi:DgyrCDS1789 [Dimorphilus gyrociliatus]|nr:DgyrCDS1789 [Dimorphilus gyrociliatus]